MRILLAEDEKSLARAIVTILKKHNYEADAVYNGEDALAYLQSGNYDAAILDIMMPGMSGIDALVRARESGVTLPILLLTAKSEESDIVIGLEMGADDYLPKPFSPKVLIARIKSVLRRVKPSDAEAAAGTIKRGPLCMNRGTREALLDGRPMTLTFSEFETLYLLARRPGWVYTRGQIVNEVKGDDYPVTERAIDVQMVSIRRKLGTHGDLIETVRGVGYRFVQD